MPFSMLPPARVMQAIRSDERQPFLTTSSVDGQQRNYAVRQVAGVPVVIGYGVIPGAAMRWLDRAMRDALAFLAAALCRVILAAAVIRLARREASTLGRWRFTARQLRIEPGQRRAAEEKAMTLEIGCEVKRMA